MRTTTIPIMIMRTRNKVMRRLLAVIVMSVVVALFPIGVAAADSSAADSAYNAGRYKEAAELYSQIIEKEGVSAVLLYDLGNSYYRLGKDGEAMVCYERAYKLDPGNELINQNIDFLRSKVADANKASLQGKAISVEPDGETFLESIYRLIAIQTRSNSWAVFAVMAFILFLGGLAMYIMTPNVLARKTGFFSALVFFIFMVTFLVFAFVGAREYHRADQGILTEFTTELLDEPSETSEVVSTPLHKGTKLKVIGTKTGADGAEWLKVRLNSDNVGWVKKERVEII